MNDEIHEEKFSSFELFPRSISDIEIINLDELYENANEIINKKRNKTGYNNGFKEIGDIIVDWVEHSIMHQHLWLLRSFNVF